MKRSHSIRLVLMGSLSVSALTGCGPGNSRRPVLSQDSVYTNDYFVQGVGYYHAPFRAWYPLPYNHFDPQRQRYFYGGQWGDAPHASITNVSAPPQQIAQQSEARRTDIPRGGFGSSAHRHSVYS